MQSLDLEVLQTALQWREAGQRLWLVTVARTFGASPRPPGSLLAIRDDGILVGSVSGGCIEDDLNARRESYQGRPPAFARYGVTSEEARRFGLPCGGDLEVMIEPEAGRADLAQLLARIRAGEVVAREVAIADGTWRLATALPDAVCERTDTHLTSVHGPRARLLLIGAAEIAHYLAEMAPVLDFSVAICEPREEYRASWRGPPVHWVDGMPDDAVTAFAPDPRTVVITVSHDPKLDDMALLTALTSNAGFVGAVGSVRTTAERKERLAVHFGLSAQQLARLHGPVGLPLGSRTPPEIAIAILAELVALRNQVVLTRSETKMQASAVSPP